MLRDDGPGLRTSDFREAPRARITTNTAAAMPPPRGMVPPRLGDDEAATPSPRLKPGNTGAFMAQVAVELMQEEAQGSTVSDGPIATDPSDGDDAARPLAGAGTSSAVLGAAASGASFAPAEASAATIDSAPRRRGAGLGVAVVGGVSLLALLGWCAVRDPTPNAPTVGAATPTPTPTPTRVDPDPAAPAAPEPAGLVVGSSTGSAGEPTTLDGADPSASEGSGGGSTGADGPSSTTGGTELETGVDPDPSADPDPERVARAPSARRSARTRRKSTPTKAPRTPAPAAPPTAKAPADASTLLAQARAAYNKGQGSTAYSLASKSHQRKPSGTAAELMVLSACAMNNAAKAKAALKKVPLLRRGAVRSKCKSKHGVRLGL